MSDPQLAYVESAKGLALTVVDLLWNGAGEGLLIKENYRAKYSKEEYLQLWQRLLQEG